MAQTLVKLIFLLLAINTVLYVGGVRVIGGDDTNILTNFVNDSYLENDTVVLNSELTGVLPTSFERSGSDVLNFIDSIAAVGSFIVFIVNIVFTPLGLFTSAGIPASITLMVGVPLMVGLLLGAAYFVRSGS